MIKYGGAAMSAACHPERSEAESRDAILQEVAALVARGTPVVLVHGGGPEIDRWLAERSIPTARIEGNRVTDAATLAITEAVLCGTLNKRLVRQCAALGLDAVGISGQDGRLLTARPAANRALGFVGEIVACDPVVLLHLLAAGYTPVVAPLAASVDGTTALNVNADLAAAAIAGALRARAFVMVTNVPRVLRDVNDPHSGIDHLTLDEARAFASSGACDGGMKPKIDAAIVAVENGASASYIGGPSSIGAALAGAGTRVD
ncbi:MAG TPA: acetylglutamate kinase [Candidatus Baltobacteraceae bacterium]|nr:acetylglutamate kinase [Candidatus Baltobacteraceae bacterium]